MEIMVDILRCHCYLFRNTLYLRLQQRLNSDISSSVKYLHPPTGRVPNRKGPNETRTNRITLCPMDPNIRRTVQTICEEKSVK
mmetsp:Transcript_21722/g.43556  ORF Transcript_21722/g.43556 Transcript_21722/m.43556 type:complete len:83 (+) Transcript_21722:1657-1905(+)